MARSFRAARGLSTWRRLALGTWGPPSSPAAYGMLDLDCEAALRYIERLRSESGTKVTLTHFVGKAVADALSTFPEVNGFASFGRVMLRPTIDVFFQVAFFDSPSVVEAKPGQPAPETHQPMKVRRDANLTGAKVSAADGKSVVEIARELGWQAGRIRESGDSETAKASKMLARLPGLIPAWLAHLGAFLSFDLGLDLSRFGIPFDPFGSCMVTNVGVFGVSVALAPLVPMSRTPILLTLGAVRDAPSALDGQVVVRKRVTIGVAFDHRVMDGYHAGILAKRFEAAFADPEATFAPKASATGATPP